MLTLRRRHQSACNGTPKGKRGAFSSPNPKDLKKCDCKLWVVGTDNKGKFYRDPLNTLDVVKAGQDVRDLEAGKPLATTLADLEISEAFEKYKLDLQAQREVKRSSIKRFYRGIGNALVNFAIEKCVKMMSQLSKALLNALVVTRLAAS